MTTCGDGDGSAESFCEDFQTLQEDLAELGDPSTNQIADIVDELDGIDPPEEIQSAYDDLLDTYREVATGETPLSDPAMASELAEAQANLVEVENFVTQECA